MTINTKSRFALFFLLLFSIFGIGIIIGKDIGDPKNVLNPSITPPGVATREVDINSLVSYTLPQGWEVKDCPEKEDIILFVVPGAPAPGCDGPPNAMVRMSVDPHSSLQCDVHESTDNTIIKRTCTQTELNSRKTLKLEIERSDRKDTSYYIATGSYIVKLEANDNLTDSINFDEGFKAFYESIKIKQTP